MKYDITSGTQLSLLARTLMGAVIYYLILIGSLGAVTPIEAFGYVVGVILYVDYLRPHLMTNDHSWLSWNYVGRSSVVYVIPALDTIYEFVRSLY